MTEASPFQKSYPTIFFLLNWGKLGVNGLTAAIVVISIGIVVAGCPWWCIPLGAVGAALFGVVGRSYLELIEILSEMMFPK